MSISILDSVGEIKKLDSQNMLGSLQLLGEQVKQVWALGSNLKIPAAYRRVTKMVVLGMGGSTLGAHVLKSLFFKNLKLPVEIVNGYEVPGYVDNKTLVLVSSYSGTTEEPVAALQSALKKKGNVLIIASGGTLAAVAKKKKLPALVFSTENNPCGSPRMGLGYSISGQLAILSALKLIKLSPADIRAFILAIENSEERFGAHVAAANNPAKQAAVKIGNRSAWYFASEHLAGNAHIGANQMNENGKRFGGYFLIPELNHHLLEGMMKPETNPENLFFILFESRLYEARVQKRYQVTKSILDKNKIAYLPYQCQAVSHLNQVAETLLFTSYTSYYTALLSGIDPTAIPFVDFFKQALAQK